jgi:hypothetical protein
VMNRNVRRSAQLSRGSARFANAGERTRTVLNTTDLYLGRNGMDEIRMVGFPP